MGRSGGERAGLGPTNLAQVGQVVHIEEHRSNGYVHWVHLALQLAYPRVAFVCHNQGQGGATSRDLACAARNLSAGTRFDLAVFGCGINDVWRGYQGRDAEAVAIDEYAQHYMATLTILVATARHVVASPRPRSGLTRIRRSLPR